MRCADVIENLVAYLDGEATPEEREAILAHLARCERCRMEQSEFETTDDLLNCLAPPPKSDLNIAEIVLRTVNDGLDPWCRHIRRELVAFLDGELTDVEARPVNEHLAECEDCRAEADALTRTGDVLAEWRTPEMEVDVVRGVMQARKALPAQTQTAQTARGGRLLRLLPAVAAASLLVAGGLAALISSQSAPPPDMLMHLDILRDSELVDVADNLDWLEGVNQEEELALLAGRGG